jgi:hypothetical protein
MRSSFQNTTNYKQATNAEKLVLVRTNVLYGLSFEVVKQETISYNSGITSVPTIIFINNNTQCFIDFSNQTNSDVEYKVKSFFSKISVGSTFYIYNGLYSDPNTENTADLSGEFTFAEYFNGIIKANVTNISSINADVVRYDKKYFEEIPLIVASSITSTETNQVTVIRNLFGSNTKNSFNHIGAKIGDFVSFSEIEGKYEIIEMSVDPHGVETMKVNGVIDPQILTDSKILVSLYIRTTEQFTQDADVNETQLGSCVQSQGGVVISCMDNHTASQCRFRSSIADNTTTTISFGVFCTTPETDTAVETSTTDKLVKITNLLASNIALASTNIANVAGPVNRNGNSRTGFYGRS